MARPRDPAARRSLPGRWCWSTPSWRGCRCDVTRSRLRRIALLIPEVFGHLLVQRRQDRLGQLCEQPVGPGQRRPCSWASRTNSTAAFCSADGSAILLGQTTQCRHHGDLSHRASLSVSGREHRYFHSPPPDQREPEALFSGRSSQCSLQNVVSRKASMASSGSPEKFGPSAMVTCWR